MVRAKFKVQRISLVNAWDGEKNIIGKEVTLGPVSGKEGENSIFGKYTPCGEIKMTLNNEEAAGQFAMNKEYYVDFTEAE